MCKHKLAGGLKIKEYLDEKVIKKIKYELKFSNFDKFY